MNNFEIYEFDIIEKSLKHPEINFDNIFKRINDAKADYEDYEDYVDIIAEITLNDLIERNKNLI